VVRLTVLGASVPRPRGWVLLSATLASLVLTIVGGYLTRLSLSEASFWVTHTDEVKLAIAECQRALDRGNLEALKASERKVERLTVDNPRQQRNIAGAAFLTDQDSRGTLDDLFSAMQAEEDRLMGERQPRIDAARTRSSVAFIVGVALTLLFGSVAIQMVRAQRREATQQKALIEAILESVDEGVIAAEPSRQTVTMNAVARAMVGRSFPRDRLPEDWSAHIRVVYEDGSAMAPKDGPLARALQGETSEDVVYRIVPATDPSATDAGVWVSTTARPVRDDAGHVVAAVATLRDITEQRADAERLRDLSSTDELTGLLNRRGFLAHANARIASDRRTNAPLAVLFADVNGLKRINDELGHERGDRVIKDAAVVLRSVFRDGDVLARIGGDEFVALLPNFAPSAREPLVERLTAAILGHIEREPRPYRLSMSAGITFMDWERGQSLDELLADADRAMYERKRQRAEQSMPVLRAVPSLPGSGKRS
jgi:diguanylate cyclase (GGDEF)-like protein